jgi:hypothetical protein
MDEYWGEADQQQAWIGLQVISITSHWVSPKYAVQLPQAT